MTAPIADRHRGIDASLRDYQRNEVSSALADLEAESRRGMVCTSCLEPVPRGGDHTCWDERARIAEKARREALAGEVRIRFDGPPGPECGRFVEVEDHRTGESFRLGRWEQDPDGSDWFLIFSYNSAPSPELVDLRAEVEALDGWKREALAVLNEGYKVAQLVPRRLGASKAKLVREEVERLTVLAECHEHNHEAALDLLEAERARAARLEAALEKIKDTMEVKALRDCPHLRGEDPLGLGGCPWSDEHERLDIIDAALAPAEEDHA